MTMLSAGSKDGYGKMEQYLNALLSSILGMPRISHTSVYNAPLLKVLMEISGWVLAVHIHQVTISFVKKVCYV